MIKTELTKTLKEKPVFSNKAEEARHYSNINRKKLDDEIDKMENALLNTIVMFARTSTVREYKMFLVNNNISITERLREEGFRVIEDTTKPSETGVNFNVYW